MNLISIYIHIPFCKKKCYYCDFSSYSGKEGYIESYVEALKQEITYYGPKLRNYKVNTIFFGGGTPSILTGDQITEIMDKIKTTFLLNDEAEISLEANPGTLSYDKLKDYYKSGINRLSIGLQACQDHLLQTLGRIHVFEDYLKNLEDAREIGFTNINTDLMFSLPGQTSEDWKESLKKLVDLEIPHISAYSLIVEEETPFYKWREEKKITPPDEEIELEMYHYTTKYLQDHGYSHYEISNYAKQNFECQHNLIYWNNMQYIGLGSGAHSYFNGKRFSNVAEIEKYILLLKENKRPLEEKITLSVEDEISETMFLGLRLMDGVSIQGFVNRFGKSPFEVYKNKLDSLREQGLLEWDDQNIKLTAKGIDLSNIVFVEMLLD